MPILPLPFDVQRPSAAPATHSRRSAATPLRMHWHQGDGRLRCSSSEPWDRLRFLDPQGGLIAESREAREWTMDTASLPAGPYWIVTEWAGQRSSRAFVV